MADIIIVESPYAGNIVRNEKYLRRAMKSVFGMGEIPFASHAIYTQVLNDLDEKERALGIEAGYSFWPYAKCIRFFLDYGMSRGMEQAFERAIREKMKIEVAYIGENDGDGNEGETIFEYGLAFSGGLIRIDRHNSGTVIFHKAISDGDGDTGPDCAGLSDQIVRIR